jgi:uncharacterized protein YjbI with pentapeptide repeats
MEAKYTDEQTFTKVDFSKSPLEMGDYEYCIFVNCNFSNTALSEIRFMECEFTDCNFSNANLKNTSFQDVQFKNCKMLGLQFDACNPFGFAATFDTCQLDHSIFYKMKLGRSSFINCQLQSVDFSEADLKNSKLTSCNLQNATFQNTNLEQADFRNATNYSINPEQNRLKGAKFSLPEVVGLLDTFQIKIEN